MKSDIVKTIIKLCNGCKDNILDQYFDTNPIVYSKKKSNGGIVSSLDIGIESYIIGGLNREYPNSGFVCEESGSIVQDGCKRIFYIDPIDGTFNFVKKNPFFAISIGVEEIDNVGNRELIAGVVYAPVLKEIFWATKGGGAYLKTNNKKPRKLSIEDFSKEGCGLFSTGSLNHKLYKGSKEFLFCEKNNMSLRIFGSVSLEMVYVASGRTSLFMTKRSKSWDIAAASIIVSESGGCVSCLDGKQIDLLNYKGSIVCAGMEIYSNFIS